MLSFSKLAPASFGAETVSSLGGGHLGRALGRGDVGRLLGHAGHSALKGEDRADHSDASDRKSRNSRCPTDCATLRAADDPGMVASVRVRPWPGSAGPRLRRRSHRRYSPRRRAPVSAPPLRGARALPPWSAPPPRRLTGSGLEDSTSRASSTRGPRRRREGAGRAQARSNSSRLKSAATRDPETLMSSSSRRGTPH